MTDEQILIFIWLPICLISMFFICKIIKIYKNVKRKLHPVFELVREFMSKFKHFTNKTNLYLTLTILDSNINCINSVTKLLKTQSDDNYLKYGDLLLPEDLFDYIINDHKIKTNNKKISKKKRNIDELLKNADNAIISFNKITEKIKKFPNFIEKLKENEDSEYRDIYYETKEKIDDLYPEFLDAVKEYNETKNHIEELLKKSKGEMIFLHKDT